MNSKTSSKTYKEAFKHFQFYSQKNFSKNFQDWENSLHTIFTNFIIFIFSWLYQNLFLMLQYGPSCYQRNLGNKNKNAQWNSSPDLFSCFSSFEGSHFAFRLPHSYKEATQGFLIRTLHKDLLMRELHNDVLKIEADFLVIIFINK